MEPLTLEAQIADVSGPLASVLQICKSGNIVVVDDNGGIIMNKATRKIMPIELRDGSYELETWIPRKNSQDSKDNHMDFLRQGH